MDGKTAYAKRNYYRMHIYIPIEQKEALQAKADADGVSLNRYIVEAIEQKSGLKLTLDKPLPWLVGGKGRSGKSGKKENPGEE